MGCCVRLNGVLCRQLHTADVNDLRAQLESVSAQLSHYQQCHRSCCLPVHSQAEPCTAAAQMHVQHTACQARLHDQQVHRCKQQHKQAAAEFCSGDLELSPLSPESSALTICCSDFIARQRTASPDDKEQMHVPDEQSLQQQCEKQSAQISRLKLQLQAATAKIGTLRASCSSTALPLSQQAAHDPVKPQFQSKKLTSTSVAPVPQCEHWMMHRPGLLHCKTGGDLPVRKALRKWAAVAKAESLHRR